MTRRSQARAAVNLTETPALHSLRILPSGHGGVAEGEELQTNLLQASQRNPANSGVLDEVFGTHRGRYRLRASCSHVSFPKITSGHIDDAVRPRWEWRQWHRDRWTARCKGASFC